MTVRSAAQISAGYGVLTLVEMPGIGQHVNGEVALVERDDDLGLCEDRGGQDVAVVGVGELQSRHQRVETGNAGVGQRGIHGGTALFELFGRDVRSCR